MKIQKDSQKKVLAKRLHAYRSEIREYYQTEDIGSKLLQKRTSGKGLSSIVIERKHQQRRRYKNRVSAFPSAV